MTDESQCGAFLGLPAEFQQSCSARCIVAPVPCEAASTFGEGSRRGPAAIIEASHEVEFFDAVLGCEPYRLSCGMHTLDPIVVENADGERLERALCQAVAPWAREGRFVVTLGGEHTSAVGAIRAFSEACAALTVIQLDAHSDLRAEYMGSPWNHACAMARVLDFNAGLVQVGIRSQCAEERELARESRIPVFYAHEVHSADRDERWIDEVIEAAGPEVYITFDCDVLDPSIMPATGTPEPGGLSWRQTDAFFSRLCRRRRLVGMDVCELAPISGTIHPQFTIAKLIYRIVGYVFINDRQ